MHHGIKKVFYDIKHEGEKMKFPFSFRLGFLKMKSKSVTKGL